MKNYKEVIDERLYNHYSPRIKKYVDKQIQYLGENKNRGFSYCDNLHVYKDINAVKDSDNLICYLLFNVNNKVELKECRANKQIKYAGHFNELGIVPRKYDLNVYEDLMDFEELIGAIASI